MDALTKILRAHGIMHQLTPVESDPTIVTLAVGGDAAIPMWRKLRGLVDRTGRWPIVLGSQDDAEMMLADNAELNAAPIAQVIREAGAIDIFAWMQQRKEMDPDYFEALDEGPWPGDVERSSRYSLPYDVLTHRPHPSVLIALLATNAGTQAPAYLRIGNWNDCPDAAVHVAFAEYWNRRHGAELVGISHDIIEMTVPRPPTTREQAMILAREQFMYCSDIVDQGVESISNLGAYLLGNDKWYFWWD